MAATGGATVAMAGGGRRSESGGTGPGPGLHLGGGSARRKVLSQTTWSKSMQFACIMFGLSSKNSGSASGPATGLVRFTRRVRPFDHCFKLLEDSLEFWLWDEQTCARWQGYIRALFGANSAVNGWPSPRQRMDGQGRKHPTSPSAFAAWILTVVQVPEMSSVRPATSMSFLDQKLGVTNMSDEQDDLLPTNMQVVLLTLGSLVTFEGLEMYCRAAQTGDASWARVRYRVQFLIVFLLFLRLSVAFVSLAWLLWLLFLSHASRAPQDLVSNTVEAHAKRDQAKSLRLVVERPF